MTDGWYQSRTPKGLGLEARSLRLMLTPEDWVLFDKIASEAEWTRSRLASMYVKGYLREHEALRRQQANELRAAETAWNGDDSWPPRE